jgi:hypothetical protein
MVVMKEWAPDQSGDQEATDFIIDCDVQVQV